MRTDSASVIDADHAAFMLRGVSITIAACGRDGVPNQARATGCRVSADGRVTIFLSATQAAAALADIRGNGRVAAVFSEPSTHRTIQLKGSDAAISRTVDGDLALVQAYRDAFVRELEPLGFSPALIRTLLACPPADIVALTFTPAAAFSQTPGPQAGEPLRARP